MPCLGQGFFRLGSLIATLPTQLPARPATALLLFHVIANIALTAIRVQWDLRSLQHQEQLGLVQVNAPEQTVECRVSGLLGEDRVKARLQVALACEGGTPLVLLEVRVQRPDPAAHTGNILTVLIIQRQQLVNQALRVYPPS